MHQCVTSKFTEPDKRLLESWCFLLHQYESPCSSENCACDQQAKLVIVFHIPKAHAINIYTPHHTINVINVKIEASNSTSGIATTLRGFTESRSSVTHIALQKYLVSYCNLVLKQ